MWDLQTMLSQADEVLLPIIAKRWGIPFANLTSVALIDALMIAMLDPVRAEKVYDGLSDQERGALQSLAGAKGHRLPVIMFNGMFGEIRKMGAGRIEREKPHEQPANIAEALFYRGLIAQATDKVGGGLGPVIYVPSDLIAVLPLRKTGYSAEALDALPNTPHPTETHVQILPLEDVEGVIPADTSIVDDFTTLLAFLQLETPLIDPSYALDDAQPLLAHLLVADQRRLRFMVAIGISAGLIDVQAGKAYPNRTEARRWLGEKRAIQLKALIDAWRTSTDYLELWHTPGLISESGWTYDAVAARQALLDLMLHYVPKQEWWALDDFIDVMKVKNPNFQRPGGDYDSWYIRNDEGDYLRGLNSWDAVEGAVLEFYLTGPLHWLGLTDLGEDALRLSAYGRAVIDPKQTFPTPTEVEDKITVQNDGTLLVTRKASRLDRFQLTRFTTWAKPATLKGDPYLYKLDAHGIQRAADQGINTEQIGAFVKRMITPIPPVITKLLETWKGGATAQVTLEELLVLRTTAREVLDAIFNEPSLRRYLGARLGEMAVIVRPDQWEALRAALGERGIEVEWLRS
ncbi:MAG: hypothetical protein MUF87_04535 [Anaerolineae bacterium]|nr:hypothetical protein [Anaerolineae bacterium]